MIKDLTRTEREVLEHFIRRPQEVHVRGLAEEVDMPYSSVRNSLESLEGEGLLKSEEKGNMTIYQPGNGEFRKAKKLVNLEKLEDSGLVEFLEKELRPEAVVLFGSFLEGRDSEDSDVDLAIISGREKDLNLEEFEEDLCREVELTRVENLKEENPEFRNTLANGLVLQGYLDVV